MQCRYCQNYIEGQAAFNGECEVMNGFFDLNHMPHLDVGDTVTACHRFIPTQDYLDAISEEESYRDATRPGINVPFREVA